MIKFKNILQEEKILVPRHLETRDEEYKRITYQKIQNYIKKGSKGDLDLSKSPIIMFPDNFQEIGGNLNLFNSKIQSLGNLRKVKGFLDLGFSQIQSLGNLQEVGGSLYLGYSQIKSLGNLQKVGRYLYLDNSKIESLGNLKTVEGNLFLRDTPLSKQYSKEKFTQMLKDKGIEIRGRIII